MRRQIECADVLDWAAGYSGEPFHAVLCDPSYGLGDHPDIEALLTAWLAGDDYDMGPGFMAKDWDTLPGPRYWAAIRKLCHPGAYLFAFGGTRTADLLSVAIRLGGWERFDEIDWLYGSGFPKSHNIGKAIDREAGAEREVIGEVGTWRPSQNGRTGERPTVTMWGQDEQPKKTAPATPLAAVWEGYGTALKPAHEPILCFRNPKAGTYAENCVATGAGSLWIEGSRVNISDNDGESWRNGNYTTKGAYFGGSDGKPYRKDQPAGRWPPNVALSHIAPRPCPACDGDGCPDCGGSGWLEGCRRVGVKRVRGTGIAHGQNASEGQVFGNGKGLISQPKGGELKTYADPDGLETVDDWICEPSCPVAALGEMSGESKSNHRAPTGKPKYTGSDQNSAAMRASATIDTTLRGHNDTGTAARFYPQSDWRYEIEERLAGVTPFYYCAKSSRRERDSGLDEFPPRKAEHNTGTNYCGRCGKRVLANGSGVCCECPDELRETVKINKTGTRNPHPTVKPIALCLWLARLLSPPPEYAPRRLLVPFAGSGSEICAALLSGGFEEIVGIEMEAEYVEIAEARLRFWAGWSERGHDDPKVILKEAAKEAKKQPEPQMKLDLS